MGEGQIVYDGLGNPVGFLTALKRFARKAVSRLAPVVSQLAPFVPIPGAAALAQVAQRVCRVWCDASRRPRNDSSTPCPLVWSSNSLRWRRLSNSLFPRSHPPWAPVEADQRTWGPRNMWRASTAEPFPRARRRGPCGGHWCAACPRAGFSTRSPIRARRDAALAAVCLVARATRARAGMGCARAGRHRAGSWRSGSWRSRPIRTRSPTPPTPSPHRPAPPLSSPRNDEANTMPGSPASELPDHAIDLKNRNGRTASATPRPGPARAKVVSALPLFPAAEAPSRAAGPARSLSARPGGRIARPHSHRSERGQPGRPRSFVHFFQNPPLLTSDPRGKQLHIVGGNYRVTRRGIEG